MSFRDVVKRLDEQVEEPKRTDYRCAAKGCPNTGCIDDVGAAHRGKCYWHAQAEFRDWPAVTERIQSNFDTMRNWGQHAETPDVGDKRQGAKAWAYALKAREQSGERLTPAQKNAWRDALRREEV